MIDLKTLGIYSLSLVLSGSLFAADADFLKNKLEKEGYNFVKKIDAPEGMEGWTGYKDEYPSTLFIAKIKNTISWAIFLMHLEKI